MKETSQEKKKCFHKNKDRYHNGKQRRLVIFSCFTGSQIYILEGVVAFSHFFGMGGLSNDVVETSPALLYISLRTKIEMLSDFKGY